MNLPIKLIVGLGNPGSQYTGTRHNAGAEFVQQISRQYAAPLATDSKFFGATALATIANKTIRLLIPHTFMNLSGKAIAAMAHFYKIHPEEILIAHDDLDFDSGVAKLKFSGGHGGHNGLRSAIECLGNSRDFHRLRLGIGHPQSAKQVSSYVLKKPSADERISLDDSISRSLDTLTLCVSGQWQDAIKQLHTNNKG